MTSARSSNAVPPNRRAAPDAEDTHHDAVDVTKIEHDVDRALALRSSPLDREELEKLERLLLSHIKELLPEVDARISRLWRGSLEWYRSRTISDRIAGQARHGLTGASLSDIMHVAQLARDCRWLLEWNQPPGPSRSNH